jgi:methylisocitrate lyase
MSMAEQLRTRLGKRDILVLPGAADALTARIIQEAGFEAVYATGAGFANAALAVPDVGLPTMTEVVQHTQRMADAVSIPVIVDADTGYGNALNVLRTVRELERAGAAAIQIEDQVAPKKCGHFEGKEVVTVGEMVSKLQAAVATRRDALIVARTDARAVEGLDSAINRARAYVAAGADVIFVEAPQTVDEMREVAKQVQAPLLANMVEGGKTPLLTAQELEDIGYRIALFANTALRVSIKAVQDAMQELHSAGTTNGMLERMVSWHERQRLVGLAEYQVLDERFAVHDP